MRECTKKVSHHICILHSTYRIDAYRTPAFYKNMRVSNGVIFESGVLIKFLLKKWTFGAKKWRFIQICPKWHSNQEWRSIGTEIRYIKVQSRQNVFSKFGSHRENF